MQRAGHADFETTKIYLREAENLSAGFGTVFPRVPTDVLLGRGGFVIEAPNHEASGAIDAELLQEIVELTGIETVHTSAPTVPQCAENTAVDGKRPVKPTLSRGSWLGHAPAREQSAFSPPPRCSSERRGLRLASSTPWG